MQIHQHDMKMRGYAIYKSRDTLWLETVMSCKKKFLLGRTVCVLNVLSGMMCFIGVCISCYYFIVDKDVMYSVVSPLTFPFFWLCF